MTDNSTNPAPQRDAPAKQSPTSDPLSELLPTATRLGKRAGSILAKASGVAATRAVETAKQLGEMLPAGEGKQVSGAVTVLITPGEAYAQWRDFSRLGRWIDDLQSVEEFGNGRSRWTARGASDTTLTWEAELTDDRPGEAIAWRTLPGSAARHEGAVTFAAAPGDRGTEIQIDLTYFPPAGPLGGAVARLTGHNPADRVRAALRQFKAIQEAGERPTIEGQTSGRRSTETEGDEAMAQEEQEKQTGRQQPPAPADGPDVIRDAEVTQATEVANVPHADDIVGEASEDSFPTSDPPAYAGRSSDDPDPTAPSDPDRSR